MSGIDKNFTFFLGLGTEKLQKMTQKISERLFFIERFDDVFVLHHRKSNENREKFFFSCGNWQEKMRKLLNFDQEFVISTRSYSIFINPPDI